MRGVSIIGMGKTKFGVFPDRSLKSLIAEAGKKALLDAKIDASMIQAFYLGNFAATGFNRQNHVAAYAATALGLPNVPCTRTEAACASSGAGLREGIIAVASGLYDFVLVGGVEKMNSVDTPRVTECLAQAADWETEAKVGATFPAMFALVAQRHMHEYGTTRAQMAAVAVKNHANGALNPDAHLRKVITIEQALNGRMIAEPLTLYDCSLISDGAAAVLLVVSDRANEFTPKPVCVRGAAQASDRLALHEKPDITTFAAVRGAAEKAYRMAGVGPNDIDFAELHDCFTIAEIIALEDLGFVPRGQGGPASAEGLTALDGKKPINTSGGLKSKGHPVGATGVAQICEVVEQLRGECGERQLKSPTIGLAQNLGGSGATCVVSIFSA